MKLFKSGILLTLVLSASVFARPVSYPGGLTLMQMNDNETSSIHLHYSPTARYSIGYLGEYWHDAKWQFHGVQFNALAKRWNQRAAQSNIYLKSGLGLVRGDTNYTDNKTELAGFLGFAADAENRRLFSSYENRYYYAGEVDNFFMQKARLGIAPYIGDYGDLHTWLMLQFDHRPEAEDSFTVTPLVRFFKNEYLAELGLNDEGNPLFNLVIRF